MDTTDVPDAMSEGRETSPSESPARVLARDRYTLHHFPTLMTTSFLHHWPAASHNADAVAATTLDAVDPDERPSQLLLDFWYACAAIQAWGTRDFRTGDYVRKLNFAECGEPVAVEIDEGHRRGDDDSEEDGVTIHEMADISDVVLGFWLRTVRKDGVSDVGGLDDEVIKRVEEWLRVHEESRTNEIVVF